MPKRIQRIGKKGWRLPQGAIFVGHPSGWANPWKVGDHAMVEWPLSGQERHVREVVITPELAVALYKFAFAEDAIECRHELLGRDLACWCPLDQPCHADVLLELANGTHT